jgi:hypothetical protein
LDPQGAAGILPKSSDEHTQEGRGFSTIKVSELNETIPLDVVHRLANEGRYSM